MAATGPDAMVVRSSTLIPASVASVVPKLGVNEWAAYSTIMSRGVAPASARVEDFPRRGLLDETGAGHAAHACGLVERIEEPLVEA